MFSKFYFVTVWFLYFTTLPYFVQLS